MNRNWLESNWFQGPDPADRHLCQACYERPCIHQLYCGDQGLIGVCGPCLLAMERRHSAPEVRWLEAQYLAPSARGREDR
jgi:hypothetical protein